MLPFEEARQLVRQAAQSFGTEIVAADDALRRVLAEPIVADRDYPPFPRAMMDGVALRSADVRAGLRELRVVETLQAGIGTTRVLATGECFAIMTGAAVPPSADAVVRREDVALHESRVQLQVDAVRPFQHIAAQGEDARAGTELVASGVRCRAPELNALAAVGRARVRVQRLPSVAIVSTGDEVVPVGGPVSALQIRDSNAAVLAAMLGKFGIRPTLTRLAPDEPIALAHALADALACDLVIVSGGVSAGDADYVPAVLQELRVREILHRVAIRPGKPFWFGLGPKGGVFALPGNSLSCQVVFRLFVESYLRTAWGMRDEEVVLLPLGEPHPKRAPLDEWFPCRLSARGLLPTTVRSSGDITAALGSDGLALHDADKGDLRAGELVAFWPW